MNISQAYKKQSQSDLQTYKLLNQNNSANCHQMHYLMMSLEKLAKSFSMQKSHYVMQHFVRNLAYDSKLKKALGIESNTKAFMRQKQILLKIANQFENWVPSRQDSSAKNSEYPYCLTSDASEYFAPCEVSFDELNAMEINLLIRFLNQASNIS